MEGSGFFLKIMIPSIGVLEFQSDFSPRNGMEGSGFLKDPGIPALFFNNDIFHRVFPWIFSFNKGDLP